MVRRNTKVSEEFSSHWEKTRKFNLFYRNWRHQFLASRLGLREGVNEKNYRTLAREAKFFTRLDDSNFFSKLRFHFFDEFSNNELRGIARSSKTSGFFSSSIPALSGNYARSWNFRLFSFKGLLAKYAIERLVVKSSQESLKLKFLMFQFFFSWLLIVGLLVGLTLFIFFYTVQHMVDAYSMILWFVKAFWLVFVHVWVNVGGGGKTLDDLVLFFFEDFFLWYYFSLFSYCVTDALLFINFTPSHPVFIVGWFLTILDDFTEFLTLRFFGTLLPPVYDYIVYLTWQSYLFGWEGADFERALLFLEEIFGTYLVSPGESFSFPKFYYWLDAAFWVRDVCARGDEEFWYFLLLYFASKISEWSWQMFFLVQFFFLLFLILVIKLVVWLFYLYGLKIFDSWQFLINWFYNADQDAFLLDVSPLTQLVSMGEVSRAKNLFLLGCYGSGGNLSYYNADEVKVSIFLEETFGGYTGFLDFFPAKTSFLDLASYGRRRFFGSWLYRRFKHFKRKVKRRKKNNRVLHLKRFLPWVFAQRPYHNQRTEYEFYGHMKKEKILKTGLNYFDVNSMRLKPRFTFFPKMTPFLDSSFSLMSDTDLRKMRKTIRDLWLEEEDPLAFEEDVYEDEEVGKFDFKKRGRLDFQRRRLRKIRQRFYEAKFKKFELDRDIDLVRKDDIIGSVFSRASLVNLRQLKWFDFKPALIYNDFIFWKESLNFDDHREKSAAGSSYDEDDTGELRSDIDVEDEEYVGHEDDIHYSDGLLTKRDFFYEQDVEEELAEEEFLQFPEEVLKDERYMPEEFFEDPEIVMPVTKGDPNSLIYSKQWSNSKRRTNSEAYLGAVGLEPHWSFANYNENIYSTFYDDLADFYWLNADSPHYKNFFLAPLNRFLVGGLRKRALRKMMWVNKYRRGVSHFFSFKPRSFELFFRVPLIYKLEFFIFFVCFSLLCFWVWLSIYFFLFFFLSLFSKFLVFLTAGHFLAFSLVFLLFVAIFVIIVACVVNFASLCLQYFFLRLINLPSIFIPFTILVVFAVKLFLPNFSTTIRSFKINLNSSSRFQDSSFEESSIWSTGGLGSVSNIFFFGFLGNLLFLPSIRRLFFFESQPRVLVPFSKYPFSVFSGLLSRYSTVFKLAPWVFYPFLKSNFEVSDVVLEASKQLKFFIADRAGWWDHGISVFDKGEITRGGLSTCNVRRSFGGIFANCMLNDRSAVAESSVNSNFFFFVRAICNGSVQPNCLGISTRAFHALVGEGVKDSFRLHSYFMVYDVVPFFGTNVWPRTIASFNEPKSIKAAALSGFANLAGDGVFNRSLWEGRAFFENFLWSSADRLFYATPSNRFPLLESGKVSYTNFLNNNPRILNNKEILVDSFSERDKYARTPSATLVSFLYNTFKVNSDSANFEEFFSSNGSNTRMSEFFGQSSLKFDSNRDFLNVVNNGEYSDLLGSRGYLSFNGSSFFQDKNEELSKIYLNNSYRNTRPDSFTKKSSSVIEPKFSAKTSYETFYTAMRADSRLRYFLTHSDTMPARASGLSPYVDRWWPWRLRKNWFLAVPGMKKKRLSDSFIFDDYGKFKPLDSYFFSMGNFFTNIQNDELLRLKNPGRYGSFFEKKCGDRFSADQDFFYATFFGRNRKL